jgi:hypothetical protein
MNKFRELLVVSSEVFTATIVRIVGGLLVMAPCGLVRAYQRLATLK